MHIASRRVAAILAVAAAVTTVIGSALPLFTARMDSQPQDLELTITSWGMEATGGGPSGWVPANGYPLVFAAVLLVFAAVWCRSAARPGALPRTGRVAVVATTAGGAFLAGAVWMVTLQVTNWVELYGPPDEGSELGMGVESGSDVGLWILLVAAVLGVAAVVPALMPGPAPVPVAVVDPEAPTPPFGLALPLAPDENAVVAPIPRDEPETVDPLTGLPTGSVPSELPPQPLVIPAPPPPAPPSGPAVPLTDDPLAEPPRDRA